MNTEEQASYGYPVHEKGYPSYEAVNGISEDKKTETLVILMEECGEVIQECSKILRFGALSSWQSKLSHQEQLHKELGDLLCMIRLTEKNLEMELTKTQEYSNDKYLKLKKFSKIT